METVQLDAAHFIARLLGPVLLTVGIAILVNRRTFEKLADDFVSNYALIFVTGMIVLASGIAIVSLHNEWDADWRLLVTAFGWMFVVGGIARMMFPNAAKPVRDAMAGNALYTSLSALTSAALGAFLTAKGFFLL